MESIERQEARHKMNDSNVLTYATIDKVMDILFPPFEPKEGEVYWSGFSSAYLVHGSGSVSAGSHPLTDKEKGL